MRGLRGFVIYIVILILVLSSVQVGAAALHNLQFYFSPQIMDVDTGEIVVDLRMRNFALSVPKRLGAMCGFTLAFEYDEKNFTVLTDSNGAAAFSVDEETLVKKATDIEVKMNNNKISVVFLDSTLKENLIDRDGILCRFVLKSKNPNRLWNSGDYYPIRFKAGSIGVVTYDVEDLSVGRYDSAEGVDGKVGGYNIVPDFVSPSIDKRIVFTEGSYDMSVNGETLSTDAAPYKVSGEWMIPVRFLSENIGMSVEWDQDVMTASAYADYKTLKISINDSSPVVYINAARYDTGLAPQEINGRIYIPLEIVTGLYPDTEILAGDTELTISFK